MKYVVQVHECFPFFACSVFQVYVAAIRNGNLSLPENPADLYEINKDKEAALEAEFLPHTDAFRSGSFYSLKFLRRDDSELNEE